MPSEQNKRIFVISLQILDVLDSAADAKPKDPLTSIKHSYKETRTLNVSTESDFEIELATAIADVGYTVLEHIMDEEANQSKESIKSLTD